jgi:glycosyltransferase involved in cell wall biosynthesis
LAHQPGDIQGLANAICSLAADRVLRQTIASNARVYALEKLSESRYRQEWLKLIASEAR